MGDQITSSDLKPADFASSQEVRWCPGCGDYAILKAVRKTMADVGASLENTLVISGIGCAARFPYYMATYGFHTIHGRAPTIASGAMLANPDLDVWIITGDGDALAIGGNHFIHMLRRNFNCQILLFNNEIYGLTKGQYSPTSRENTRSPSTPIGLHRYATISHPCGAWLRGPLCSSRRRHAAKAAGRYSHQGLSSQRHLLRRNFPKLHCLQ